MVVRLKSYEGHLWVGRQFIIQLFIEFGISLPTVDFTITDAENPNETRDYPE